MHHGYAGELEEAMRRSYYDKHGRDIGVKGDMIEEINQRILTQIILNGMIIVLKPF